MDSSDNGSQISAYLSHIKKATDRNMAENLDTDKPNIPSISPAKKKNLKSTTFSALDSVKKYENKYIKNSMSRNSDVSNRRNSVVAFKEKPNIINSSDLEDSMMDAELSRYMKEMDISDDTSHSESKNNAIRGPNILTLDSLLSDKTSSSYNEEKSSMDLKGTENSIPEETQIGSMTSEVSNRSLLVSRPKSVFYPTRTEEEYSTSSNSQEYLSKKISRRNSYVYKEDLGLVQASTDEETIQTGSEIQEELASDQNVVSILAQKPTTSSKSKSSQSILSEERVKTQEKKSAVAEDTKRKKEKWKMKKTNKIMPTTKESTSSNKKTTTKYHNKISQSEDSRNNSHDSGDTFSDSNEEFESSARNMKKKKSNRARRKKSKEKKTSKKTRLKNKKRSKKSTKHRISSSEESSSYDSSSSSESSSSCHSCERRRKIKKKKRKKCRRCSQEDLYGCSNCKKLQEYLLPQMMAYGGNPYDFADWKVSPKPFEPSFPFSAKIPSDGGGVRRVDEYLRQTILLGRQFLLSQRSMYEAYCNSLSSQYRYTSLRKVEEYIKQHRKPVRSPREILEQELKNPRI